MGNEKDDRRVKYTKMVLKESFIQLLEKKDISQITIKEICEDADINRATFYAHYSDQYDLMRRIEDELFENIISYLSDFPRIAANGGIVDVVEHIFNYIRENAKLCKLLLSESGDLNFQKKIISLVYNADMDFLVDKAAVLKEDVGYIQAYIVTGCVGVIQQWLDDDMKKSDRAMAELLVKLSLKPPAPLT